MNILDLVFPALTVVCFAAIAVVARRADTTDSSLNPLGRRR
ncbi:hypothetical protein [Myceligenerans pegani]|nr:hypothetical protein [Myceligenerans sp. TRM 65318]